LKSQPVTRTKNSPGQKKSGNCAGDVATDTGVQIQPVSILDREAKQKHSFHEKSLLGLWTQIFERMSVRSLPFEKSLYQKTAEGEIGRTEALPVRSKKTSLIVSGFLALILGIVVVAASQWSFTETVEPYESFATPPLISEGPETAVSARCWQTFEEVNGKYRVIPRITTTGTPTISLEIIDPEGNLIYDETAASGSSPQFDFGPVPTGDNCEFVFRTTTNFVWTSGSTEYAEFFEKNDVSQPTQETYTPFASWLFLGVALLVVGLVLLLGGLFRFR
jgi:hypothetical protein